MPGKETTPAAEPVAKAVKRVQRPDSEAQKKEIADINDKIKELQKKQSQIQEQISGTSNIKGSYDTRRQKIRADLDALNAEKEKLNEAYNKAVTQKKALQATLRKKVFSLCHMVDFGIDVFLTRTKKFSVPKTNTATKTLKKSTEPSSINIHFMFVQVNYVLKSDRDLDKKIEAGSLTLNEEKRIVSDISGLKKIRKTFSTHQSYVESEKQKIDALNKELDEISPKRDETRNQINVLRDQLKEIQNSQSQEMGGYSELISSRNALKSEIDALYEKLRETRKLQKEQWDEFKVFQDQEIQRKRAAEKARRKEELLQKLERRAAEDLEYADVPAYTEEINTCTALIDFLKTQNKSATSTEDAAASSTSSAVEDKKPEGTIVFKKKDEDFLVMGTPKKKGGKKADSSKKALKLDVAMIQQFASLKIDIPSTNADIDRAITDLEAKRTEFKDGQAAKTAENKANAAKRLAELKAEIAKEIGEDEPEVQE
ncbi:hypothetical protein HK098_008361 [Nowakowskiella sp. JEL0407]|nr:hypothetical protein HK098_008361 [Nowakowskiella sp. JEL0407]